MCWLILGMTLAFAHASGAPVSPALPPVPMREFRGAWIASVSNLDWPSKPGLPVAEQKAELSAMMDQAAALGLNALLLQVRPACDALYKSALEPWSEFLTGRMGEAPSPAYDPLQWAIAEAHARGLELHAWFNPYRAGWNNGRYTSPRHISQTRPALVRKYGRQLWLDPGELAVQEHTLKVILDVVSRYDLDGVHLDDYFYPYPENGLDFPDSQSWNKYRARGGQLARADWRRHNVDTLVRRLQAEIRRLKPWVTFGISPFGIWRPGFPPQVRGFDAYNGLYADARHWLVKGWVDYLAPQLYWPIGAREQSFSALLHWWEEQPSASAIWPGGAVTHAGKWPPEEIPQQIQLTRNSDQPGYIHWNLSSLLRSPDALRQKLRTEIYRAPALVPVNPGDAGPVTAPTLRLEARTAGERWMRWHLAKEQTLSLWVLSVRSGGQWTNRLLPAQTRSFKLPPGPGSVALTAVSRYRNLSKPVVVHY